MCYVDVIYLYCDGLFSECVIVVIEDFLFGEMGVLWCKLFGSWVCDL